MRSGFSIAVTLLLAIAILAVGCSGSGDVVTSPDQVLPVSGAAFAGSHEVWGLWQFTADPEKETLEVMRMREGNFHINAIVFLEPPAMINLTLDNIVFNGNTIEADIGLRHPFLGLNEFTGFDVCGVLISNGSVTGFSDPDIRIAADGDTRLTNPDGLTRWWNPAEFPSNGSMFGYTDGLLGVTDSVADFNSTVNGYKYFCDDLANPDDPMSLVTLAGRGHFSAGQKNVRRFIIDLGAAGLVFNYAVDASWQYPTGSPPYAVPDDFGPGANKVEAWRVDVTEISNTLWNNGVDSGGSLSLSIDLYDWFDAELNNVKVESPGNFDPVGPIVPTGGGTGFSTYEIDITSANPSEGTIEILIIAETEASGYGGLLPGKTEAAYFLHSATVGTEPSGELVCDLEVVTPMPYTGWATAIEFDASNSYDPQGEPLSYSWDFDDDGNFGDTYEYGTDENPSKYFGSDYVGNVCVRVSSINGMSECCQAVNITAYPSKNIPLRNVEAYDIAIDHADGDLFVLYADGLIWQYDISQWYQQNTDTQFADLVNVCTSYNLGGMDYMDIASNSTVCITGTSSNGWNRIIFFDSSGTDLWGCNTVIGSSRTIFDAMAFVATGDTHDNSAGYASGRTWSGTHYMEMGMNMPTGYSSWHWNTYSYPESGGFNGQNKIYLDYSVAVEADQDGDELWWLESDASECYASRWTLNGTSTYSSMAYDNAYFGTGTPSDSNACWNDARDICRDDQNRYFVLDELSTGEPKVKGFDVTSNPGTSIGAFGDSTSIDGEPRRIEGSDYDSFIVVMHEATVPQKISIFYGNELPN